MPILTCPGCGRSGLRIPDGRRGKVTCPRCGAEWFHPDTAELSEVEFRCSESGARFVVQSSRRSPLHKFVIQAIKNAPARPSKPIDQVGHGQESDSVPVLNGSTDRLPGPKPAGLLARLFGRSTAIAHAAEPSLLSQERASVGPVATRSTYNADQYNWSSFICPYCNATGIIKCGGGHLVCDGTVQIRSGRRFHQCFCGDAGFIEGTIKTIEANQRSIEVAGTVQGADGASSKEKPSPSLDPPPKDPKARLLPQERSTYLPNGKQNDK